MQRIYQTPWTVEEYIANEGHKHVVPESVCANCGKATQLHAHARYDRWVATLVTYGKSVGSTYHN